MTTALWWLQAYFLFVSLLFIANLAAMHLLTWLYRRRYDHFLPPEPHTPPLSVVKPVKGLEQETYDNFASFAAQDYPAAWELLFCVQDEEDPAIPVIEQLIADYPDRAIRCVCTPSPPGMGRVANMSAGVEASRYDTIVFSDTDVRAPADFLRHVVQPLGDPQVGLVFGSPAFRGAQDLGAAFMAMTTNPMLLAVAPPALLLSRRRAFGFAIGTTMATRKEVLVRVGGLTRFRDKITEDVPLARAVEEAGYRLHLLRRAVLVLHRHYRVEQWGQHMHRWLVMLRRYVPALYLPSFVQFFGMLHALLYGLLTLAAGGSAAAGLGVPLATAGARVASLWWLNAHFVHDRGIWRWVWAAPLHDLARVPVWVRALLTDQVLWRGMRFRILADATAVRVPGTDQG